MSRALFWNRMLMVGCVPIPSLFLHFVMSLLGMNPQKRLILKFAYTLSALILFSVPTPLLVASVTPKMGFHFWANPGPFFFLYFIHFMACYFYSHHLMYRQLKTASGNRRNQIKYVLLGTLPAFAGGATNFPLWYNIPIPPVGNALVAAYVAMAAYAILQHQLMDINVAIRKSLVYSILVTLLTAGYFGSVYIIEHFFQIAFGYHSLWFSLAAFALMALAFQPLKIGIQRLVDLLIFRAPQEAVIKRMERLEQEAQQTEKLRYVATLAAGICHELKGPLQITQTYAELLPERFDDAEFRENCSKSMQTEIIRVNSLLKQLMDFAKPKAPALQPLEPHKILDSTLDFLSNEFLKRQVNLKRQWEADGAIIHADPDQMRQVILNLVMNALQAVNRNGQVSVTTRQDNGWFVLEVADTGPGISPKILPKLFEPFNTDKSGGNGLGLSIVHSIVQEHRGKISVQNRPGLGAAFIIKLPL